MKEKVANRQAKEAINEIEKSKFQKLTFFGLNDAFSSPRVSETVTKIYDLSNEASEAPKATDILSGIVNSIDQEVTDAIYKMVSQGATLKDIFDCISFHTEGAPMKVERKDTSAGSMVNSLVKMISDGTLPQNNAQNGNSPSQQQSMQNNAQNGYNDRNNYTNEQTRQNNNMNADNYNNSPNRTQNTSPTATNSYGTPTQNDHINYRNRQSQRDNYTDRNNYNNSPHQQQSMQNNAQNGYSDRSNYNNEQPRQNNNMNADNYNNTSNRKQNTSNNNHNRYDNPTQNDRINYNNRQSQQPQSTRKENRTADISWHDVQSRIPPLNVTTKDQKRSIQNAQTDTNYHRGEYRSGNRSANATNTGTASNMQQARELDEKDMTLMDISDNAYYDVNKHKFMKIATISTRYPKLVTVQPLDQKATELLRKSMKPIS